MYSDNQQEKTFFHKKTGLKAESPQFS